MRYFASALLLALLSFSPAGATVYVWTDQSGTLVLTNKQSTLPEDEDAKASLTIYETTSASEPAQAVGQHETRAAGESEASRQPGPAGVVVSSADGGPRRDPAPSVNGGTAGKQPTLAASGGNAPDASPHGAANAQAQSGRGVTDPRALLALAARREPPQVLVSVVAPSARPLSTSKRISSGSGDTSVGGGMSGSTGASLGNASSSGMVGTR